MRVEYRYPGLNIQVHTVWNKDGDCKEVTDSYVGEPTEELMSRASELLSDHPTRNTAEVTVSADMAVKDYGTGAGASVSITLRCEQSDTKIQEAVNLAGELARKYAKEQRDRADEALRGMGQSPEMSFK